MTETTMKTGYTIEQDLVLTPEMHLQPVIPELVKAAGFAENPAPGVLLLAQVMISAGRYGGEWKVNAAVGETVAGSIWCAPGTGRDEVLGVADAWIRANEHVTFVPGRIHELPQGPAERPYFVTGVVLVRGDRFDLPDQPDGGSGD